MLEMIVERVQYYRLRTGAHQPAFRTGERYRFLRRDGVVGYVFVELAGRPRCVPERDFEPLAPHAEDEVRGSSLDFDISTGN